MLMTHTAQGGVSVEVASDHIQKLEQGQVGLVDEDIDNHYNLLRSEDRKQDDPSSQELREKDIENHYKLLSSELSDEKKDRDLLQIDKRYDHTSEQPKPFTHDKSIMYVESDYYLLGNEEEIPVVEQAKPENVYQVIRDDDNDYEEVYEENLLKVLDEQRRLREEEISTCEAHTYEVPVNFQREIM